jgi:hypothetical protein
VRAPAAGGAAAGAEGTGRDRAAIVADAQAKRDATLRARAALAGVALRRIDAHTWYASRWSLIARIDDGAVEQWLDRATGARP